MEDEITALRGDLALKETLESELEDLDGQLADTEDALATTRSALEQAQSELEARSGDISLQQGEVEQLHAELDAANEKIHRLETQSARTAREHERALADAKWDVSALQEQLDSANAKLADAVMDRELSSASSADVGSRLKAYLAEIERLKRVEGTLSGELAQARERGEKVDEALEKAQREIGELREDKELLNVALESKAIENTLLGRQVPARPGSTTPKKRLAASTSRVPATPRASVGGSLSLAASTHGPGTARKIARPISAAGAVQGQTQARATSGVSAASSTSAQSFVTATSNGGGAGARIVPSLPARSVKGHRRESSVQGMGGAFETPTATPRSAGTHAGDVSNASISRIPTYANETATARARRISITTPTPVPTTASTQSRIQPPTPLDHRRSSSAAGSVSVGGGVTVLGTSTRQNEPALSAAPAKPNGARKAALGLGSAPGRTMMGGGGLKRQSSVSSLSSVSSMDSVGGGGRASRVGGVQRMRSLSGMVEVDEQE
jgi:predicted  nucleic acid-binding Zn-ribbon protein